MTLIKCRECGTEISDKAAACVKCGAPLKNVKPKGKTGCLPVVAGIIGLFVIVGALSSNHSDGPGNTSEPKAAPEVCKSDDLQCLGDKGVVGAGVYCKDSIERMAKHSVRWTDGTFEMKFSRFRWADQAAGEITYIGDKAEFQNGFGAYTPVTYECDMAADNKTVLDVRVHEGRLPG
jgi:ribosomal protein L40E